MCVIITGHNDVTVMSLGVCRFKYSSDDDNSSVTSASGFGVLHSIPQAESHVDAHDAIQNVVSADEILSLHDDILQVKHGQRHIESTISGLCDDLDVFKVRHVGTPMAASYAGVVVIVDRPWCLRIILSSAKPVFWRLSSSPKELLNCQLFLCSVIAGTEFCDRLFLLTVFLARACSL